MDAATPNFDRAGPRRAVLALAFAFEGGLLAAQMPASPSPASPQAAPATAPTAPLFGATAAATASAKGALPLGYDGIELGMGMDAVIAKLKASPWFSWRGPEDVSLLPSPNQSLIDIAGPGFIRQAFFQFNEGRLWAIILNLANDRVDHYTLWSTLVAKYGEPTRLDPAASTWEDGRVRLSLERPLSLRYLDLATFARLRDAGAAKVAVEELERRDFLAGF